MSPAREELRRMADAYWKQSQADNWWIGEYIRGVVKNDFQDKDQVIDLVCALTDEEWKPIKGHLDQWFPSFDDEYVNAKAMEGTEERSRIANELDLLRAFS